MTVAFMSISHSARCILRPFTHNYLFCGKASVMLSAELCHYFKHSYEYVERLVKNVDMNC